MKTKFFKTLFLLLISFPLGEGWGGVVLSAQNGVTVSDLSVDAGMVTFNVSWKTPMPVSPWSDSVWVFVDYNDAGVMKRLPLASGATLTATSAPGVGEVLEESGNDKGVWVVGNARTNGSFSATVRLLTATADIAGVCVYGSNYPPVGEYTNNATVITFTGTSPYIVSTSGGGTWESGNIFSIPGGTTVESFVDKTGAPGIFKCIPMSGSIGFTTVPNPVAKGQQVSLDVNVTTSTPPSSAITYSWSVPGFAQYTYTGTPFVTAAPSTPAMYPATLTARSTGYCDLTKAGTVTVVDCLNPATTFTLSASASGFCVGDAGVTFALSGTESGRSYTLLQGGSTVSTLNGTGGAATFSGTFNTAGVYTAQSEADGVYCSVVMSGTPNISANSLPAAPTISQPANVCENGGSLVFTITGYSGTPTWTNVGGGVESGLSVTFSSPSTGTKTVQARTSQTYTNAPTCYSATSSQSATVNAVPTSLSLTASPTTICNGQSSTLTASATSGASYSRDNSSWQTATTFSVTPTANASYTLYVKTAAGCSASASNAAAVTVNAYPAISVQPAATSVCPGGTVTLSVTASPVTAYRWRKNGTNTNEGSGSTTASYTTAALTAGATYSVVVANGSCSVTSDNAVVSMKTEGCCTAPGATVNFTAFNPCSNAATGATWTLQDTRESGNNQNYKVKKLADGHIWMVQDMKFGDKCNKTAFAGSSSDQTGSKLTSISGYIYGDCMNATNGSTPSNRGYLYDWAAAIQKAGAYYGSSSNVGCSGTATGTSGTAPGACRGICPEGWHIPTGNSTGEFQALHTAIGGCSTSNDDCWDAASAFEGVLGGNCNSGGSLGNQGSGGGYWSSTYYDSSYAYNLYFTSTYTGPGTYSNYKNFGRSVRCVRNY